VNTTGFRFAGAVVALAMCTACSGGAGASAVAPSSGTLNLQYKANTAYLNGRPITAARPNLNARPVYASVPPDAGVAKNAKGTKYYDYIINDYTTYASIFDYPTNDKQIGTINNVGGQGCTNVLYGYGKKIVWIVAGYNQISEYKSPTKLMKSLSVPYGDFPSSCAMDTGGDLAVGILAGTDTGSIALFKKATGSPTFIGTNIAREYFDGYDDKGNLFLDGFTNASQFGLDEIPKGSKRAEAITLSDSIGFPGSVQWDGKYLTVLDQYTNIIHQYTVSGTKATLKGSVTLSGASDCAQTWIAAGVVYCGDAGLDNGSAYAYPKGGKALVEFQGNFDLPLGTVASEN
jgi:hypothetical protein